LVDRSLFSPFFAIAPVFDELRDDARFDDLVRRVYQVALAEHYRLTGRRAWV
jgi:hypothetical protein